MRGGENGDQQQRLDSADLLDLGTADSARCRVRAYFQSLRDQLCVQEVAALTVVDTHVRERLCSIRQQEEEEKKRTPTDSELYIHTPIFLLSL